MSFFNPKQQKPTGGNDVFEKQIEDFLFGRTTTVDIVDETVRLVPYPTGFEPEEDE